MTRADKTEIQLMFKRELEPVNKLLDKYGQTLFGDEGGGGLKQQISISMGRLDVLEAGKNKGAGRRDLLVVLGGGTLGYIIKSVAEIFTKKGF